MVSMVSKLASEFGAIKVSTLHGRFRATVICTVCAQDGHWSAHHMPAPEIVRKKLQAMGWSDLNTRPRCRACPTEKQVNQRKLNAEYQQRKYQQEKVVKVPVMNESVAVTIPKPSPSAGRAHRDAIAALEIYFDENAGRYKDGKNDASIAKEIGLSETYVAEIRTKFFGAIKPPSELSALTARIEQIGREAAAAVEAIKQDIAKMVKANGWAQ